MTYFSRAKKQGARQPDYVASSVEDIDFSLLSEKGIKCVAFDVDGTITKDNSPDINLQIASTIKRNLDTAHITNRFLASNSKRSLDTITNALGAFDIHQPTVTNGKPSKAYYESLVEKSGCQPHEIAMIGDRLLQDVIGAKRAGLITVLVAIKPEYAGFIDKITGRQWWQPFLVRKKFSH